MQAKTQFGSALTHYKKQIYIRSMLPVNYPESPIATCYSNVLTTIFNADLLNSDYQFSLLFVLYQNHLIYLVGL